MSRKSIAFIGGGTNSAIGHAHISAAIMDGLWHVSPSLFSNHQDINQQTHHKFGIPWTRHYPIHIDFLDENGSLIDLLVIATPSPLHCQMVLVRCF